MPSKDKGSGYRKEKKRQQQQQQQKKKKKKNQEKKKQMKNNQKKSKKRKQKQNENMNKKEKQKGSARPGFCNRGFGETNEAEPLKLQGKCCFWGILNHTNTNKQEEKRREPNKKKC